MSERITFKQLRNTLIEKTVYTKRIKNVNVKVVKKGKEFAAYIDGDHLDDYDTQKDAESSIQQFMKNYKG